MSWARVPVMDEGECLRCEQEKRLAIPMGDDGMFGYCAPCAVHELADRIEREYGTTEDGELVYSALDAATEAICRERRERGEYRADAPYRADWYLEARSDAAAALAAAASAQPPAPEDGERESTPPCESVEVRQWDGTAEGLRALADWAGNGPDGEPQFSWIVSGDETRWMDPMLGAFAIRRGDRFAKFGAWVLPVSQTEDGR